MLIVADIFALVISYYIYVTYDRSAAAVASSDGTGECRWKVNVKPPCCRLTLFHWFVLSLAVVVLAVVTIMLPDVFYRRPGR